MNRRPSGLLLSKAIPGFIQYQIAEGLALGTTNDYQRILQKWVAWNGDVEIAEVTSKNIRDYLVYLRTEYVPQRITGNNNKRLSSKSIRNIWIGLSSFFHWASDEFQIPNPMKQVPAPKFTLPEVVPYTKEEVEALLKAAEYSAEAKTENRRSFRMALPQRYKSVAILLTLLDCGARANELCSLRIADYEPKTGKLFIRHGVDGGAKGGKGRTVFLGKVARRALWRYLATREDGEDPTAPLFVDANGRPITKNSLRLFINRLGKKAGVKHAYSHRFRHTFAITYLRSGGDIFTLKSILGHNSLQMVEHYARIAEVDVENAHRRASPADNWRL